MASVLGASLDNGLVLDVARAANAFVPFSPARGAEKKKDALLSLSRKTPLF